MLLTRSSFCFLIGVEARNFSFFPSASSAPSAAKKQSTAEDAEETQATLCRIVIPLVNSCLADLEVRQIKPPVKTTEVFAERLSMRSRRRQELH